MKPVIRVVLADDHAVLRAGLNALLSAEPDIQVVGEAANGSEVLREVEALTPDVVVLDLSMPVMSGLDALQYLTTRFHTVKTLVLTMHTEEQYILRAIRAGSSGYVLKSAADVELIQAIRRVYAGEPYFYGPAMQVLLDLPARHRIADGRSAGDFERPRARSPHPNRSGLFQPGDRRATYSSAPRRSIPIASV